MATKIDPKRIRIDCDTQSRVEMNESVIAEYAEAMERGDEFPAILVFFNEEANEFILADGFHRYAAHMRAKPNDPILAEQRIGTVEDAFWASLAANQSHGLRRTNADKRNVIKRSLLHPKGHEMSDRQIAKYLGVDHKTVSATRRENEATGEIPQSTVRTGIDGRTINIRQIGKSKTNSDSIASCSSCMNFTTSSGSCMLDSEKRTPWTEACEEFEAITDGFRRREPPPPPEEFEILDPSQIKKRRRNTQQYKPRHTIAVDVPLDNPQLAAAELRTSLGVEYLEQCFIAVRVLLSDDPDDYYGGDKK